ncbi:aldo/keto reductase [Marinoscillum sp.]|uniref:aldo/keto reductase n=1 Tax=Marinoscillum sp. TaxID=2024838 RepID=UPI003BAD466B
MEYRKFGASGYDVSCIGLGLAALGRPGYINLGHEEDLGHAYKLPKMEAQTHAMLSLARAQGINYFDAAQSYGKAESFLSSWLKAHPEEEVVVGSKWGYYYTADWSVHADKHEIKEHTLERLDLQWPESRQRLDPALKIYQIHSATLESGVLENGAVLERLDEIREMGYVIGLSLSGVQQSVVLEKALAVKVGEKPLFGSVQATYNCLEQSVGEALQKAFDRGLGVIIKEGLANGRLTSRNKATYLPVISQIARRYQTTEDTIALAYILSKPFVSLVLSGAAVPAHLLSNVSGSEIELSPQDLNQLDGLRMKPAHYWEERAGLAWN